ncbi:MAG: GDP-mannose-dependent alpha-(1-6)-phosphatidylinositol monomannoside mannosyltransferase [Chlamydiae bacterium]|nr:GDP-mannose-dependent alpha-(1-6)-phosphatidylinositol monomannoside mannosyltransferase [Chlamydiota bacterium]
MKCALVHDWLVTMGGAEKVLEALIEVFDVPIFTLLKDEKALLNTPFSGRDIRTSFLQSFPKRQRYYRNLAPLFPLAIQSLDLSSYDLIISSSHAVAKSIRKKPGQLHICYCHTPFRAAWDLYEFHIDQLNPVKRLLARPTLKYIRHFDRKTQGDVDHFIANSTYVAKRIETHYGRHSTVIHPPVNTDLFQIAKCEDYYVTCSRLVPYKRVDILIAAFEKFPKKKLLIIGDGPEKKKLQAKAPQNVEFLGRLPHPTLRETIAKAKGFLFAAEEDFGIVLVEAQAAGVPVIAYGYGGSIDTVLPGSTGIFFREQTSSSVVDALIRFEKMQEDFESEKIQAHAQTFSKERFKEKVQSFVMNLLT